MIRSLEARRQTRTAADAGPPSLQRWRCSPGVPEGGQAASRGSLLRRLARVLAIHAHWSFSSDRHAVLAAAQRVTACEDGSVPGLLTKVRAKIGQGCKGPALPCMEYAQYSVRSGRDSWLVVCLAAVTRLRSKHCTCGRTAVLSVPLSPRQPSVSNPGFNENALGSAPVPLWKPASALRDCAWDRRPSPRSPASGRRNEIGFSRLWASCVECPLRGRGNSVQAPHPRMMPGSPCFLAVNPVSSRFGGVSPRSVTPPRR